MNVLVVHEHVLQRVNREKRKVVDGFPHVHQGVGEVIAVGSQDVERIWPIERVDVWKAVSKYPWVAASF